MNIIELAKEAGDWNGQTAEFNDAGLERFAALVRAEREWVDLTDEELAESLGWKLGDPMYMTIVGLGKEAIAAFKEKNK